MFIGQTLSRFVTSYRSLRVSRGGRARPQKHAPAAIGAVVEPLEARCMLSADLTGTIGAAIIPPSVISGSPTRITLPVVVLNSGDAAVPAGNFMSIAILARPEGTSGASDIPVRTLVSLNVSSLAAGSSRTFSTALTLPEGMATGEYSLVAEVDSGNAVDESDDANNEAVSGPVNVVAGARDLSATLGTFGSLPVSVVVGRRLAGSMSVVVQNVGNLQLSATQKVTVQIYARDTTTPDNPDILLQTLANQWVGNLRAGASVTLYAQVNLAAGLPADDYQIVATVTPTPAMAEPDTANNTATLTTLGAPKTVRSAAPFVDLTGALGTNWTLPSSVVAGTPLSGTVSVVVTNQGNVGLPSGQQIYIPVVEHDTTHPGNPDILLNVPVKLSVSGLAPGASRSFNVTVSLPAGLPADSYRAAAVISPVQDLAESSDVNNAVTLTALGAAKTLISADAFRDLAGNFGTIWTLPATLTAGAALAGNTTVVVKNLGNVALPTGQRVTITLYARDPANLDDPGILLQTFPNLLVNSLRPGSSVTFGLRVSVPAGLPADSYQIVATITPTPALSELNTINNTILTDALTHTKLITVN
jgi:hypothetical protein